MTDVKLPRAVILAAGSGTRFLRSGGIGFKQLSPFKGEPVIARLVRQIEESMAFSGITVVLGSNSNCADSIRAILAGRQVNYTLNHDAERDNNLLSYRVGVEGLDEPILLIEADCVVESTDLSIMVSGLQPDEIRWANIGDAKDFDYGGLIETDPETGQGIGVDVLAESEFTAFKISSRQGVKMFGLSAFGAGALANYRQHIDALSDPYDKYFHYIANQSPGLFQLTTRRISNQSFSFNTISELCNVDD